MSEEKKDETISTEELDLDKLVFEEINPGFWDEEAEETIAGVYVGMEEKSGDLSAKHFLDVKGRGIVIVWGSAILDERLKFVNVGSVIRITYKGKEKTKSNRDVKIYKVEVAVRT